MSESKSIAEIEAGWDAFDRPVDGTRYRHYRGGEYVITATGFIEETEAPAVVYRSLTDDTVWVRTAENFFESVEQDGEAVARFTPVM